MYTLLTNELQKLTRLREITLCFHLNRGGASALGNYSAKPELASVFRVTTMKLLSVI